MADPVVVASILIERHLSDEGDMIAVSTADELDEPLALVDALGMLRFAEDSIIREHMGETPEEDE